jgi:hypothetical protein
MQPGGCAVPATSCGCCGDLSRSCGEDVGEISPGGWGHAQYSWKEEACGVSLLPHVWWLVCVVLFPFCSNVTFGVH